MTISKISAETEHLTQFIEVSLVRTFVSKKFGDYAIKFSIRLYRECNGMCAAL